MKAFTRLVALAFFGCFFLGLLFVDFCSLRLAKTLLGEKQQGATKKLSLSPCGYRDYPSPDRHSGLPFLADVFASHDAQWVYFVAVNRGMCDSSYQESDRFSARNGIAHRFLCAFSNNGALVMTEFIHWNGAHESGSVFRCRIPADLQHLVASPQTHTRLHIDLHALENLTADPVGPAGVKPFPSMDVRDMPKLENLPVCHAVEKPIASKTYNMTAVTRIKIGPFNNGYKLYLDKKRNNTMTLNYEFILQEWIEHHVKLGMDRFIIYVHDETPHGSLENALKPMIDSGLVTYKWFPFDDCIRQEKGMYEGYNDGRGHMAATMSALHRYGYTTKYFAHMDVDEFFVPLQRGTNLLQLMEEVDVQYDVVAFRPFLMVPCNGTVIPRNQVSIRNKWQCWDGHYADQKLIFQPERLWQFWVHYPLSTPQGTKAQAFLLNDTTQGLLAHYRRSNDFPWRSDEFYGQVVNGKMQRLEVLERVLKNFSLP